jgi:hypothetical protein
MNFAKPIRFLGAIGVALCVCSTGAACQSAPAPLPDGTYTYAISERGKPEGTSTIRVSRSNGEILIDEHASPMEEKETTRRALDPTFVTRTFSIDNDGRRYATLTLDGETATLELRDLESGATTSTKKISAPPSAPFVGVFDLNVGLFFHLPATQHFMRASRATIAVYAFDFKSYPLAISTATAPRPPGIAASDASIAVTSDDAVGTLWYDPQTFVLDEFDLPSNGFTFKRVPNPS